MSPTTLRRRTPADAARVVGWIPDADALHLFTGPQVAWPLRTRDLVGMESQPGFSAWVLVEGTFGAPIGHFDLTVVGPTARLGRVVIAPRRRGEGLAHVLVEHAVSQARALGATRMRLNVIVGNEPALHTYLCAGFRECARHPRPEVTAMERSL